MTEKMELPQYDFLCFSIQINNNQNILWNRKKFDVSSYSKFNHVIFEKKKKHQKLPSANLWRSEQFQSECCDWKAENIDKAKADEMVKRCQAKMLFTSKFIGTTNIRNPKHPVLTLHRLYLYDSWNVKLQYATLASSGSVHNKNKYI